MELRADLKLIIWSQDLYLFELIVLFLDTSELYHREDTQVHRQTGQDKSRKEVSEPQRSGISGHLEGHFSNHAITPGFVPIDIESILTDEDLAKCPIVRLVVDLGDVRVLVFNVPESQIAKSSSKKLVDFREKFELRRAKSIENFSVTLIRIDLSSIEINCRHARVISALALALVQGQEWLGECEVVLVVSLKVLHFRANPLEEVGLHVWVDARWQVNTLRHRCQWYFCTEFREEYWAWLDLRWE